MPETMSWAEQARRALLALAGQASSAEPPGRAGTIPLDWFRWLPARLTSVAFGAPGEEPLPAERPSTGELILKAVVTGRPPSPPPAIPIDRQLAESLSAVDQVRGGQGSLRLGWLYVAGRLVDPRGTPRPVFQPLLTRTVRARRSLASGHLVLVGDVEITDLVTDPLLRLELENAAEYGGGGLTGTDSDSDAVGVDERLLARMPNLREFAGRAADAAGLPARRLVPVSAGPEAMMDRDDLVIIAGLGVHSATETFGFNRADSLRRWAEGPLDTWTAFHSLYVDVARLTPVDHRPGEESRTVPTGAPAERVGSPFLLTEVQRSVVHLARTRPVTVVSGAPGTGKSHTVTAIACDALAHQRTVLIAAKSEATVDALLTLQEQAPGLDAVVFGSNERRRALADRLAGGQIEPSRADEIERAEAARLAAADERDRLRAAIVERLQAEQVFEDGVPGIAEARLLRPDLFGGDVDLTVLRGVAEAAAEPAAGWWSRRRQRRRLRRLADLGVVAEAGDLDGFLRHLAIAEAHADASRLAAAGGLELGDAWDSLLRLDDQAREASARWLAVESRSPERLDRSALAAVAALATALRSGRAARRRQLAAMGRDITRALPLWIGTLADIDDLLPPVPGLFDLVVLDEASSIDQPLAAAALLRGRRAIVVGDPRQLRHVSFLSDEVRDVALVTAGVEPKSALAAKVDVRRNSAFDLAAGAAPVLVLDEHFRCHPHLVAFVAHRLYDDGVQVATTNPRTEVADCVDVVRVTGARDGAGVVQTEVTTVLDLVAQHRAAGATSVGVVSPFRAQADAIEAAALQRFDLDDLEAMDLRIGTVHAFQGNERDVVIASMGAGEEASANTWRFIQDPHLLTVLVTRARHRFVIVTAGEPPPGLLADYLAQADAPPGRAPATVRVDEWAAGLARDLAADGVTASTAYRAGRHVIDLCLGTAARFVGVEASVHADGPDSHIERHLALRRAGWTLREAYPSRWAERRGELLVELGRAVEPGGAVEPPG